MKLNFWPFNRGKQSADSVPQEIQEYYQAEQRDRKGLAMLVGAGTLVATVLLVLGLFFGGRWVYRQLADDAMPAEPVATTEQTDSEPQTTQEQPGGDQAANDNQNQGDQSGSTQPETTSEQNDSSASTAPDNVPGSGAAEEVPRTGPEVSD